MSNEYFASYSALPARTLARAEAINAIFDSIIAGFDLLPSAAQTREGRTTYSEDTGTANAYIATIDPQVVSYTAGLLINLRVANANTGPSTINVNSIGVVALKRFSGSALEKDDLLAGAVVSFIYDGTYFRLVTTSGADLTAQVDAAAASAVSAAASAASASSSASSASASAITAAAYASGSLQKNSNLSDVSSSSTALGNLNGVPKTRTISSGTGLSGGGDLTSDRTLTVTYGTTSGTAAQGNDSRITGAAAASTTISAGTGLTGGGDLSANRTLAVSYGTSAGTAAQGNDSRITGALQASNNLSDVTASTARGNLGVGSMATRNVTIQSGGSASGGSDGDVFFIY